MVKVKKIQLKEIILMKRSFIFHKIKTEEKKKNSNRN